MKKVIIAGSSRNDGNTHKLISKLIDLTNWDIINLNDYNFSYYDYSHLNRNDDFLSLVKQIVEKYDTIIFATPVYWYSMSGIMKVFFDRLSDLLTIEKSLGRKLRGKNMAAISSSEGNNLGDNFWLPFAETAKYLDMNYLGGLHTIAGEPNDQLLESFINMVERR